MTPKQNHARNEAFQLLNIAERILREAGLTAYADETKSITQGMVQDSKMLVEQEMNRHLKSLGA